MARNRLTARMRDHRAVEDDIPYPGTVNQPDRKFKRRDQYDNYVETINHPLPDMRHEWKDNPRDEIGFGIPKESSLSVASVRVAANKAVRIAVLLLGEKVEDEVIEAQARDLMGMRPDSMDRTLERFAASEKLYKAEDKEDEAGEDEEKKASDDADADDEKKEAAESDEKKDEEKKASEELVDEAGGVKPATDVPEPAVGDEDKQASLIKTVVAAVVAALGVKKATDDADADDEAGEDEEKADEKKEASVKSKKAEDEKKDEAGEDEEKADEKKASAKPKKAEDKKDEAAQDDEKADEKKASDDADADEAGEDEEKKEASTKKADDDEDEDDDDEEESSEEIVVEASRPNKGANEMDIELTSSMDTEMEPDAKADAQLASIFENDEALQAAALEKKRAAGSAQSGKESSKAGIKRLGGQPRVASQDAGSGDISGIWETAPDVSSVFK